MNDEFSNVVVTCLVDLVMSIEMTDEAFIDLDFSVALLESVAAQLRKLGERERDYFFKIVQQLEAEDPSQERKRFCRRLKKICWA
jgi:hypothetical protein